MTGGWRLAAAIALGVALGEVLHDLAARFLGL